MKKNHNRYLLPFSVILAASNGDVDAINAVLKHYAGYIRTLSQRPFVDDDGNVHMRVDPELYRRLETKLITRILKFEAA